MQPPSVRVRAAATGDLMSIRALSMTTPWEKSDFVKRAVDLGHVSVAVNQDIILGFIVWNDEFFEKPFVWLIVVDSNHRRLGIGTKLFEYVEARHAGHRLYTSTNRSNYIMAAFLSGRGYAVVGEIDLDPGDPEIFYRQSRHVG
ncbi:MAG TPA: GNAT family N-acetyltransferase [Candidatus Tumulicola sp.]|jgi:GNAT superfamily N-acetyltransferase